MNNDRIKSLKRIPISKLVEHPKNHRTHSDDQKRAMQGVLDEIGFADALIVREHDGKYQILDGHLRKTLSDDKVPCLIVDLDDNEADIFLTTHDHITTLAGRDQAKLDDLISDLSVNNPDVQAMLDELATKTEEYLLNEGEEFDESCVNDVESNDYICPNCGHTLNK